MWVETVGDPEAWWHDESHRIVATNARFARDG